MKQEQERLLRLQHEEQENLRRQQEEQERILRQQQEEQDRVRRQQQDDQEKIRRQQEEQERLFRQQQEEQERLLRQQQEQERYRRQQEQESLQRQQQEEQLRRQQQQEQLYRQQQQQEQMLFQQQQQQQQMSYQHEQHEVRTQHHHQQMTELHHSELSMQMKTGGLVYRNEQKDVEISDYVGSLRPTTTGSIIRTEGDVVYTQAPSGDDFDGTEPYFSEVELRKTSTGGKKDVRQSGVFVGIFGENNALVNSSEAFDYEKHSVRDLVDHFSKTKPREAPKQILQQQAVQAPPLSYLREQAKGKQFHYQEKGKQTQEGSGSVSEKKMEESRLQEMMMKRRNSLKDYLLMEFSEGTSSAQQANQLLDPSSILKGGKPITDIDSKPPPHFSLRSQSASPSSMMLKSNIKPPTPKPFGVPQEARPPQPRRLVKPEPLKPLKSDHHVPPSPPPVQPRVHDLSKQCIHDEQLHHFTEQQQQFEIQQQQQFEIQQQQQYQMQLLEQQRQMEQEHQLKLEQEQFERKQEEQKRQEELFAQQQMQFEMQRNAELETERLFREEQLHQQRLEQERIYERELELQQQAEQEQAEYERQQQLILKQQQEQAEYERQQQLILKQQQEQQQRAEYERQQLEQQQQQQQAEYERKQQQMQADYEKQQLVRQQQAENEKRLLLQQQQQAEYEASLQRSKQSQPEQLSSSDDDTVAHYTSETKIVCRPYPSPLTLPSVMSPTLEYQQQFQEHFGHQSVEKRSSMLYTPGSRPSSKMSIEQMMEELNEPLPPMQPLPTDLLTNFQQLSTFQSSSSSQHVQTRSSTQHQHEWQPQAFGSAAGLTRSSMTQSASSYSADHKTSTTSRSFDESSTQPVSS